MDILDSTTIISTDPHRHISEHAAEALTRYQTVTAEVFYDLGRGALTLDQAHARIDALHQAYDEERVAIYREAGL